MLLHLCQHDLGRATAPVRCQKTKNPFGPEHGSPLPRSLPAAGSAEPAPGGSERAPFPRGKENAWVPPSPTSPAPCDAGPALLPASQARLQRPREGRELIGAAASLRARPANRRGRPARGAGRAQPCEPPGEGPGRETRGSLPAPGPVGFGCRLCPAAAGQGTERDQDQPGPCARHRRCRHGRGRCRGGAATGRDPRPGARGARDSRARVRGPVRARPRQGAGLPSWASPAVTGPARCQGMRGAKSQREGRGTGFGMGSPVTPPRAAAES